MLTDKEFRTLASFRHSLRQFQFYSEQASRALGLTAQQYQALLAIKGHDDRIEELGLVERKHTEPDRRRVVIELTPHGRQMLRRLVSIHRRELHRIAPEFARYFRHFARSATGGD